MADEIGEAGHPLGRARTIPPIRKGIKPEEKLLAKWEKTATRYSMDNSTIRPQRIMNDGPRLSLVLLRL